jgi:hypothetical protein
MKVGIGTDKPVISQPANLYSPFSDSADNPGEGSGIRFPVGNKIHSLSSLATLPQSTPGYKRESNETILLTGAWKV